MALVQATVDSDDRMQAPHSVIGTKEPLQVFFSRVVAEHEIGAGRVRQRLGLAGACAGSFDLLSLMAMKLQWYAVTYRYSGWRLLFVRGLCAIFFPKSKRRRDNPTTDKAECHGLSLLWLLKTDECLTAV